MVLMKKLIICLMICMLATTCHASRWKNLVGRWGSGAGETDDIRIDGATNSLQTLTYEHHEIHSGWYEHTNKHS